MWNRHRESKNTKLYEIFIHLFEFKGFSTWGEIDTIFLCWLLHRHSQPNQRSASVAHKVVWPRPGLNLNPLVRKQELNSLLFSNLSPRFRCVTSPTSPGSILICDFYFDISEWHISSACVWTPALMLHLTNLCAKRKVLILTKPKGKICKTKSLRNYITYLIRITLFAINHLFAHS